VKVTGPASAAQVASTVLLIAYPVVIYAGLTRWGPRSAALLMLALLLPALSLRVRLSIKGSLRKLGLLPLTTGALLALSAALDNSRFMLAVPAVMNALLLGSFAVTMIWGPPMIERFARLVDAELNAREVSWCRSWTLLWTAFFALNGTVAAVLALWGPLKWWTFYNGLIAYLLVGCLFATEWTWRKIRFRRFGTSWGDRLFGRLLGRRQ